MCVTLPSASADHLLALLRFMALGNTVNDWLKLSKTEQLRYDRPTSSLAHSYTFGTLVCNVRISNVKHCKTSHYNTIHSRA